MRSVRSFRTLIGLVAAVAIASGCAYIADPPGAAPLRYRDAIFGSVDKTTDLTYGSAVGLNGVETLKLDLYQPHGDTATERPAVVFVHGGGYAFGNKSSVELVDQANYLGVRGYVSVSINYRLLAANGCGGTGGPSNNCIEAAIGAQHDAQAAVRWLRANAGTYRVDPDRIAMAGSSAGAVTSLLAAYRPDDPGDSGNPGPSSAIAAAVSLSGGVPGAAALVTAGDAPALLFHGTADRTVPYAWAIETVQAALAAGVHINLQSLPDAGHVPYVAYRELILNQTRNFLYDKLDLAA